MRSPASWTGALILTAAIGLVGCSSADSEGGMELPTLAPATQSAVTHQSGATPEPLSGTLIVESSGCFTLDNSARTGGRRAWIVWPETARQDDDEVVLGSGRRIGQGARLNLAGAYVDLASLPDGDDPSSYFGSFGLYCSADDSGVIVLTRVDR